MTHSLNGLPSTSNQAHGNLKCGLCEKSLETEKCIPFKMGQTSLQLVPGCLSQQHLACLIYKPKFTLLFDQQGHTNPCAPSHAYYNVIIPWYFTTEQFNDIQLKHRASCSPSPPRSLQEVCASVLQPVI